MRLALPLALVVVLLPAIVGCGGDDDPEVVVPYLVGLREQLASDAARQNGLVVQMARGPSNAVRQGFVYAQDPRDGHVVTEGTTLKLWVSSG